mgnify:CR=1 FL=1
MSDYRQEFLEKQGVSPSLIQEIEKFRERYPVEEQVKNRLVPYLKSPLPDGCLHDIQNPLSSV